MTGFTLDTSGAVRMMVENMGGIKTYARYQWRNLSPFAQGYVEAALREATEARLAALETRNVVESAFWLGFSDLAPSTLAAMLKDCEAYRADKARKPGLRTSHETKGRFFWEMRQQGHVPGFPPLTLYLADDGLIYSKPA